MSAVKKISRQKRGVRRAGGVRASDGGRAAARGRRSPLSGIFSLAAVAAAAYFSGLKLSPVVVGVGENRGESVQTVSFDEGDRIAVAGGRPKNGGDGAAEPKGPAKGVKASGGSVFSEGQAPSIIGQVPEGWRVETASDIKIKFGPHKVPVGDDITFVVPVYTLVPSDSPDGVYIIEPGRTKSGHDEGGTLPSVLARLESESQAVCSALGSLSEAIAMLPGEDPPAEAVAEVPAEPAKSGAAADGVRIPEGSGLGYRGSVSDRGAAGGKGGKGRNQ